MIPARAIRRFLLLLTCCVMLGCSIGPTTEVRYVLIHPGQPCRVLSQTIVRGERLDGGGPATLDIGGWVAMPPDHWAVIAGLLDKNTPGVQPPAKATP